ncbi:hypothetical protein [Pectobacterium sp. B2J-2]|uniref:hypothetical protein n=1 Tax=Pectobacterium sp. B2J-2 TaxID=3385372 RepID=UPI0038FC3353
MRIDYAYNGVFGVRVKRGNSTFIAEGHNFEIGFMTNLKYGGIQLFDGAQYFKIYGSDIDFCGKWLCELTVNALPAVDPRGLSVQRAGVLYEVLDYYEWPKGVYKVLVIDKQETTGGGGGATNWKSGDIATYPNSVQFTVSAVTTPVANQSYFDFIHGFYGAAFARGIADFGYLSRFVGGGIITSQIRWHNSFDINSNMIQGIQLFSNGNKSYLIDVWNNKNLLEYDMAGGGTLTLPGGLNVNGTMSVGGKTYIGSWRSYGSENSISLVQNTAKTIRTFSFVGDGTVTATKEIWDVYIAGPTATTGVGGVIHVIVGSTGIELFGADKVAYPTLSASGYNLNAIQNTAVSMQVTFMFMRKL